MDFMEHEELLLLISTFLGFSFGGYLVVVAIHRRAQKWRCRRQKLQHQRNSVETKKVPVEPETEVSLFLDGKQFVVDSLCVVLL